MILSTKHMILSTKHMTFSTKNMILRTKHIILSAKHTFATSTEVGNSRSQEELPFLRLSWGTRQGKSINY